MSSVVSIQGAAQKRYGRMALAGWKEWLATYPGPIVQQAQLVTSVYRAFEFLANDPVTVYSVATIGAEYDTQVAVDGQQPERPDLRFTCRFDQINFRPNLKMTVLDKQPTQATRIPDTSFFVLRPIVLSQEEKLHWFHRPVLDNRCITEHLQAQLTQGRPNNQTTPFEAFGFFTIIDLVFNRGYRLMDYNRGPMDEDLDCHWVTLVDPHFRVTIGLNSARVKRCMVAFDEYKRTLLVTPAEPSCP